jgi:hypothetical protein
MVWIKLNKIDTIRVICYVFLLPYTLLIFSENHFFLLSEGLGGLYVYLFMIFSPVIPLICSLILLIIKRFRLVDLIIFGFSIFCVYVFFTVIIPSNPSPRAPDASVEASLQKMGLAFSGYQDEYNKPPLPSEINNVYYFKDMVDMNFLSEKSVTYSVDGWDLPETCGLSGYMGKGKMKCKFMYEILSASKFRIIAKAYLAGMDDKVFIYDSESRENKLCDEVDLEDCSL